MNEINHLQSRGFLGRKEHGHGKTSGIQTRGEGQRITSSQIRSAKPNPLESRRTLKCLSPYGSLGLIRY